MSGIAGLLALDGRPAEGATGRAMADRLRRRGPDGRAAWADGPVALAHAMLWTTPESLQERLPLQAGPYAVTADARLDNRDELLGLLEGELRALGLWAAPADVPDSSLVLAAYARWGEGCPERLLGAFAFAIWDGRERRLVCARDPIGVRPLYLVHRPGRVFAFASEPKALFAVPGVEPEVDEVRIAESLSARLYDPIGTSFVGIRRLPAAHVLRVTPEGPGSPARYWRLEPAPPPPPGEEAEGLADVLDRAVRCRTRSAYPVGSELSGGLDSSAVTAVAARALRDQGGLPLHTYSLAYSDPGTDERPFSDAVVDRLGDAVAAHYVHPERERFVALYQEIYQALDDARVRGNGYGNYLTARAASRDGVRVLLTGQDGDTAVGHGWEWFAERALDGDLAAVRREAELVFDRCREDQDRSQSQFDYARPSQIASAYVAPVLQWWAEEKRLVPFAKAALGLREHFGASPSAPFRAYWRRMALPRRALQARTLQAARATARAQVPPTIRAGLAERTRLEERLADRIVEDHEAGRGSFSARAAQARAFESFALEGNMNKLDLYPASVGVEARHPFMDVRLVAYCLGLPSGSKLRDGWTRAVLRDALLGDLPGVVLRRMNKMDHGPQQDRFVFQSDPDRVAEVVGNLGHAGQYLDGDAVRRLWARGSEDPAALGTWEKAWFGAAVTLAVWTRESPVARQAYG